VPTTATSDWTTYETIGGLRPTQDGQLEFQPGHFLSAIERGHWLVIDELNRSNFDRAFGQLFTVLSGQTVVLPYERGEGPITLVRAGTDTPIRADDVVLVPDSWRIIATMNVFDKTLLFEMSYALMRRFAFIEVPSPQPIEFTELISFWADGDSDAENVATRLLAVRKVKDVGPAAYRDIVSYVKERRAVDNISRRRLVYEAFYSFLLPQFEGINDDEGRTLRDSLFGAIEPGDRARLVNTLNTVLGLEVPTTSFMRAGDDDELEPGEDDDASETVVEIVEEESE
jgi:MoxR-like ATPase